MWASRATCRELHRDERHLSGRREEHGGLPPRGRACDVAESCNGVSDTCPADGFVVAGTVCRAAASQCDMAETCTGTSAACPSDGFKPDGTVCDDGNGCTANDACTNGTCAGNAALLDGAACDDQNSCT